MPGVSILIEGATNKGTTTDTDGNFKLNVSPTATLVFSYIGYVTQRIQINGRSQLTVRLAAAESNLEEVVIVGYGTQRKINLTGSVATVAGPELTKRPSPNIQNLLQGRVPGLDVVQGTGQPGRDNASLSIRGLGSFGASSAPLVLVDGVIGSINNLSPEDIAEVSVLKDAASAAIYGARAANGVILVTTKKGKSGQSTLEYGMNYSSSEATRLPDLIYNSAQYMELRNQAHIRVGQPAFYTQAQIDAYRNAADRVKYPNFNWLDYAFRKAPIVNHHLGFSGGTDKSTFNISLNFLDQKGILARNDYKRYNALLDYTSQVNKRVLVGTNVNFSYQNIVEPWLTNDNLVLLVYRSAPTSGPYLPDGTGRLATSAYRGEAAGQRGYQSVIDNGGQYTKNYNVNAQAYANVNVAKGLLWQLKGAFTYFNQDYRNHQFAIPSYYYQPNAQGEYPYADDSSPGFQGVNQQFSQSLTRTFYSTLQYDTKLGRDHRLNALAGYEQQNNTSPSLSGARRNFPNTTLIELNAGAAQGQSTGGNTTEWALQSVFGRLNYTYLDRYLLEVNARYDGTSRVGLANRWGLFSAFSAGWRISEETFLKNKATWLTNLKLRASVGTLGNQEIGNYPYQDILSLTAYPFGAALDQGAILTRLTDPNLRWEQTRITDVGVDLDVFGGKLGFTADWYHKETSGILAQRQDVPASVGLNAPITNAGAMVNKGWEFEIRHQNRLGNFTYGASGLLSAYRNQVTRVLAPIRGVFEVGLPYNSLYIHEWAGIFQNQAEIDGWARQPNSGRLRPGDLKIKDQNGDGTVGPDDRISINPFPKYTYSFNLNMGWKGLSLTAFFQGVEGRNLYVTGWGVEPFRQGSPPPAKYVNAWTPDNPSNTLPAVYLADANYPGVNGYPSTFFLQDASYLRLKNIYLSYKVPQQILDRIHAKGLTFYVSGDNLLTFTKYEGADPERAGGGSFSQFPQLRTLTGGLTIRF